MASTTFSASGWYFLFLYMARLTRTVVGVCPRQVELPILLKPSQPLTATREETACGIFLLFCAWQPCPGQHMPPPPAVFGERKRQRQRNPFGGGAPEFWRAGGPGSCSPPRNGGCISTMPDPVTVYDVWSIDDWVRTWCKYVFSTSLFVDGQDVLIV